MHFNDRWNLLQKSTDWLANGYELNCQRNYIIIWAIIE